MSNMSPAFAAKSAACGGALAKPTFLSRWTASTWAEAPPACFPRRWWEQLAQTLRQEFAIAPGAEITLECAPGQLDDPALDAMLAFGVNRISFGVQSLVDREAAATGRSHTRAVVLRDLERVRSAGLRNLSIDLIAGMPHQTAASWQESLECAGCYRGGARQHLHAGD